MKDFLRKLQLARESRAEELRNKIKDSTDANEVRSLGEELQKVNDEIAQIRSQIAALDTPEKKDDSGEQRGLNPMATFTTQPKPEKRDDEDVYGSMEYRTAFKDYVQRGTPIPKNLIARAGGDTGTTLTSEIGMIIPTTIMNEFIKDVSKVYGQIYSKVRKLNIKGGVQFPISKLKANFKWINETSVSPKQKAGNITEKISFSYYIGEIRVAESLLAQVVSLLVFESEIVRIMVEAYVQAMDYSIVAGDGDGKPWGITKDPRVLANTGNIIEMTAEEMADWTQWRKKLFAKVPLSKRGTGEFIFPASTVESYLLTMQDANGRPLFREATEGTIGNLAGSFFGRDVTLVEPDIVADYDTAGNGDIIGIFWVPTDYAINTNLQFGMKRYFDEDTNEWINKGLTILDGKILDISGCYLIKKKTV